MPWKECHIMDERVRFVARLLDGEKMAPLCAEFGISRKTGYKLYDRYKACGADGLTDRSLAGTIERNERPAIGPTATRATMGSVSPAQTSVMQLPNQQTAIRPAAARFAPPGLGDPTDTRTFGRDDKRAGGCLPAPSRDASRRRHIAIDHCYELVRDNMKCRFWGRRRAAKRAQG
jgi:hypothetical protein